MTKTQAIIKMNSSMWRTGSRVVGYIDLVWSSAMLVIAISCAALAIVATDGVIANGHHGYVLQANFLGGRLHGDGPMITAALLDILWEVIAVFGVLTMVRMWAAVHLLMATNLNFEPKLALNNARIWKNVAIVCFIVFFLISIIIARMSRNTDIPVQVFIFTVLETVFRYLFTSIVSQYIKDQEKVVALSFPDSIS